MFGRALEGVEVPGGARPTVAAEPLGAGSGISSFFNRSETLLSAIWNFALAEGSCVVAGNFSPRWFCVKEGELASKLP